MKTDERAVYNLRVTDVRPDRNRSSTKDDERLSALQSRNQKMNDNKKGEQSIHSSISHIFHDDKKCVYMKEAKNTENEK